MKTDRPSPANAREFDVGGLLGRVSAPGHAVDRAANDTFAAIPLFVGTKWPAPSFRQRIAAAVAALGPFPRG